MNKCREGITRKSSDIIIILSAQARCHTQFGVKEDTDLLPEKDNCPLLMSLDREEKHKSSGEIQAEGGI